MKRCIRTSAKAMILENGKLLAVKVNDDGDIFYILPGGGQIPGETLLEAVRREVLEEVGAAVEPTSLAFVIEGPQGEPFHRIDLIFSCRYLGLVPGAECQGDSCQIGWEWLDIDSLPHQPLYPSRLRRYIKRYYSGEQLQPYLGAESSGDPEETE